MVTWQTSATVCNIGTVLIFHRVRHRRNDPQQVFLNLEGAKKFYEAPKLLTPH